MKSEHDKKSLAPPDLSRPCDWAAILRGANARQLDSFDKFVSAIAAADEALGLLLLGIVTERGRKILDDQDHPVQQLNDALIATRDAMDAVAEFMKLYAASGAA